MKDLGEREQYSKTSIFGRIYQHSTTHEQKAFTLNHHHTTTSDNNRLPQNTLRLYIRVLPEQNNPDICSGAAKGEVYSSIEQLRSRPSNFLFQIARGSGATLSECTFFFKKVHVTQNTSLRQTTSGPQDKKNPDIAISELFPTKRTRTQLNQSSFQQGNRGTFQ